MRSPSLQSMLGITLCILLLKTVQEPSPPSPSERADQRLVRKGGQLWSADRPVQGELLSYHSNGCLSAREYYRDGRLHEIQYTFYADGQLASRRPHLDGKKIGTHYGWWPNGRMKFIYEFEDGAYHGAVREWTPEGKPYKIFNYAKGQEQGTQQLFRSDGSLQANYVVKEGRRYGLIGRKMCRTVTADTVTARS